MANVPELPLIKRPPSGNKDTRIIEVDWPSCPEHEGELLVRRHRDSVLWYCRGGYHFLTEAQAVTVRTQAYEVEEVV